MCIKVQNDKIEDPIINHGDFSTNFYAATQLTSVEGIKQNVVASPISALFLLSVLLGSTGPGGRTANQICQAINVDDEPCTEEMKTEIRKNAEGMSRSLDLAFRNSSDNTSLVRISNAAFVKRTLEIRESFRRNFERNGLNTFAKTDFTTPDGMNTINNWVYTATDGLIEKIYSSKDDLPASTLLVLLNAIYFKDAWEKRFTKYQTLPGVFRSDIKRKVKMMKIIERMGHLENEQEGYRLILKNFKNNRFKFVVILPYNDEDMKTLDRVMTQGLNLRKIEAMAVSSFVELQLPQFQLESEIDLVAPLKSLGIRDLFDATKANLSGIIESGGLFVDSAKQNARIEVSEDGVRAAAISSMQINRAAMPVAQHKFIVDQPFFCIIYDSQLNLSLFISRVVQPNPLDS